MKNSSIEIKSYSNLLAEVLALGDCHIAALGEPKLTNKENAHNVLYNSVMEVFDTGMIGLHYKLRDKYLATTWWWALPTLICTSYGLSKNFKPTVCISAAIFGAGVGAWYFGSWWVAYSKMKAYVDGCRNADLKDIDQYYNNDGEAQAGKRCFWVAVERCRTDNILRIAGTVAMDTLDREPEGKQSTETKKLVKQATSRSGNWCELRRMSVSPLFRRQGVASKLLGTLEGHAFKENLYGIFLSCSSLQDPAVALYERWGYIRTLELQFPSSPSAAKMGDNGTLTGPLPFTKPVPSFPSSSSTSESLLSAKTPDPSSSFTLLKMMRGRIERAVRKHEHTTALFWADKAATLSDSLCKQPGHSCTDDALSSHSSLADVFTLAQMYFLTDQYDRAAFLLSSRGFLGGGMRNDRSSTSSSQINGHGNTCCIYLAAKCFVATEKWEEALEVLSVPFATKSDSKTKTEVLNDKQ
eukprot:UC4_evm3s161